MALGESASKRLEVLTRIQVSVAAGLRAVSSLGQLRASSLSLISAWGPFVSELPAEDQSSSWGSLTSPSEASRSPEPENVPCV